MFAWFSSSGWPERGGEKSQIMQVRPVASKQQSVIFGMVMRLSGYGCLA